MNNKIKIKEQKSGGTLNSPQFALTLEQTKSEEQQLKNTYEALTKLIGNSDVVISLDSSLLNLPSPQREPNILKFLDVIRGLGLEYKCAKVASSSSPSFLSGLLGGNKNTQEQEVLAYIPHEIWIKEDFEKVLPFYGARYYVAKENSGGLKLLEDLQKMLDSEKLEHFRLIIFSAICFNNIGIFSKFLTLSEIKNILGVSE